MNPPPVAVPLFHEKKRVQSPTSRRTEGEGLVSQIDRAYTAYALSHFGWGANGLSQCEFHLTQRYTRCNPDLALLVAAIFQSCGAS